MIILNNILISEDIFDEYFFCNLDNCKGECCIDGDSGAPLEYNEIELLEQYYPQIEQYLSKENKIAIKEQGFAVKDSDNELGTPLAKSAECVFATHENGITLCAYEKAFREGKTKWRKPISCYLYPIRIEQVGPYQAIKVHHWDICHKAFLIGKQKGIPIYRFLEEPLIEKFGQDFYNELCKVAVAYYEKKRRK